MKKIILLSFSLFLSFELFATSSAYYVVKNNTEVRSDRVDDNESNIIKILNKDDELSLVTMHYSGWSMVSIGDIDGWVLSSNLTQDVPNIKSNKNAIIVDNSKELNSIKGRLLKFKEANKDLRTNNKSLIQEIDNLKKEINSLKQESDLLSQKSNSLKQKNIKISAEIVDLKAFTGEGSKKNNSKYNDLLAKNTLLIDKNNRLSEQNERLELNSSISKNINVKWVLIIAAVFIIGFVFIIFINSSRRKSHNLNTINRSY